MYVFNSRLVSNNAYNREVAAMVLSANTEHLHNIFTTTLAQLCINCIQMFCVCWHGTGSYSAADQMLAWCRADVAVDALTMMTSNQY